MPGGGDAQQPSGDAASGDAYRGRLLLREPFDDSDLIARGWYDLSEGRILPPDRTDWASQVTARELPAGAAFVCDFAAGDIECRGGRPGRHLFEGTDQVYVSFWAQYSDGFQGSSDVFLLSDVDETTVAPWNSRFCMSSSALGGELQVRFMDSANVDTACVLQDDGSVIGCGGSWSDHVFTEHRSVNACNGVFGMPDVHACTPTRDATSGYFSSRAWRRSSDAHDGGSTFAPGWHFHELYVKLNRATDPSAPADGAFRRWLDGRLLLSVDHLVLRTAAHPHMLMNQILLAPWIDGGAQAPQRVSMDEVVVAVGNGESISP